MLLYFTEHLLYTKRCSFLIIGGIMDITLIRKAIALIAKGIMEKDRLLEGQPNRYPHSKRLQHGINMFLYASLEWGGVGEGIFEYADESKFLNKYARIPIDEWFDDWKPEVYSQLDLENQPFHGYGAFAYYRKKTNRYTPSEECAVFLETQEANIIEGTDEFALYEKIIRLTQAEYCLVRRFIIEHPIMTIDERRDVLIQLADNTIAKEVINVAYEQFQDKGYRCPVCGWTMTEGSYGPVCHSEYCVESVPNLVDVVAVDGTSETIYRLKKGVMRYFAQPGKLELDIVAFCEKKKLQWELWPQKDTYDVEITFPAVKVQETLHAELRKKQCDALVCRMISDAINIENCQGTIRRGEISKFAAMPDSILIAPAMAIERGHNIVDETGHSALGAVFFMVRPMSVPDDVQEKGSKLNGYIESHLKREPGELLFDFNARIRKEATKRWAIINGSKAYGLSELDHDSKMDIVATLFILILQIFGRLARVTDTTKPAPHIHFVDGAFRRPEEKPNDFDCLESLGEYLDTLMSNPVSAEIAKTLYEPFYKAFKGGITYGQ